VSQQARRSFGLGRRRAERGQALIYGLFMMVAASTAIYFMFYTGNLANEKTKLVNTADAVAYSAGVMHARALNFDASINRAMVANEALAAQLVSLASWTRYTKTHFENARSLNCWSYYSVPVALGLARYKPVCVIAAYPASEIALEPAAKIVDEVAGGLMALTSAAQAALQVAQGSMFASLAGADGAGGMRARVMQEVADANYSGEGRIRVDSVRLNDGFFLFDGGPLIALYAKDARVRFKAVAVNAAYKDQFVKGRRWDDASPWPCWVAVRGEFKRRGGTEMVGLEEWKAMDTASLHRKGPGFFGCKSGGEQPLGYASQSAADNPQEGGGDFGGAYDNPRAAGMAKSGSWGYKGLPNFFELSKKALEYAPGNPDASKRELRVIFSIRVTRDESQTRTPDGTSSLFHKQKRQASKAWRIVNDILGGPGRNRTTDTRIFNPLLYRLSYQAKRHDYRHPIRRLQVRVTTFIKKWRNRV
jgi:hypothetical protein